MIFAPSSGTTASSMSSLSSDINFKALFMPHGEIIRRHFHFISLSIDRHGLSKLFDEEH